MSALEQEIRNLAGDDGWWHQSGEAAFNELADWLLEKGFTTGDALTFLTDAYAAVAAEFGD